jgi:DNA-binding transcriptional LysR family regulator
MSIEYYKNFIAIVECGTILAAADELCIAQPALSKQLKVMEKEFGAKLLNRGARSIELTEAGKILYKKAKAICAIEKSAKKEITDSLTGVEGTLTISLPPTNSPTFLKEIFADFCQKYPGVNIEIYESASKNVADNLINGLSEIGFIRAPINNAHLFHIYPVRSEPMLAVMSKDHPLSKRKSLRFENLKDYQIAVPRGCLKPIDEITKQVNFPLNISMVTTARSVAIAMAVLRNHVALVPFYEEDYENSNDLTVLPIVDVDLHVDRAFIVLKDMKLSVVARNFLICHEII